MEVFDTLYVFSCTAYLVTPLDLVTVFWQTQCVTKSGVHCTLNYDVDVSKTNTYAGVFIEMLLYKWFCPFVTYIKVSISAFQVKVQCWKSVLSNEFWTAQQRIFCLSLGPILAFAGWRTIRNLNPGQFNPVFRNRKIVNLDFLDLTVFLLRYSEKATKIWKNIFWQN